MVLDDQQMNVRETVETIGISKGCVGYILQEMDMKKLCSQQIKNTLS
jgi:DNA-binding transcriptional regulator GbsR (MarR family)